MNKEMKAKRQKRVLEMIARYYTSTAEPVSSSAISKEIGLSSATIRNIMLELEELGLVWQPHISAGRIPTDKGYRNYVDSLMELKEFLDFSGEYMDDTISHLRSNSIEDILSKSLQLCSRLTAKTCIALFPTLKIKENIIEKLEGEMRDLLISLYDFEDRLYLDGAHYLVEQPEFKDTKKISSALKILEDKKRLLQVLEEDQKQSGIKVHIGSENRLSEFCEFGLITANYNLDDDITGTIGILGPIRMEYEKIIPTVDHIAKSISRVFNEIY